MASSVSGFLTQYSVDDSLQGVVDDAHVPLALLLLRASRWFDRLVIDGLEERGWLRLTPAQTLAFAYLDTGGTAPSELARRLGATRQSTADLVAGLGRAGLVEVVDDPGRARGRLVRLTSRGEDLAADARDILGRAERALPASQTSQVRTALADLALGLHD